MSNKFNKRKILLIVVSVFVIVALCVGLLFFVLKGDSSPREKDNLNIAVSSPEEVTARLKELGDDFGYENALSELTEKSTTTIDGDTYYRLQQNYQGIPVYGRTVVYVTDENGEVIAITGNVTDIDGSVDLIPIVTTLEVNASIKTYIANELEDVGDVDAVVDVLDSKDLCIYNSNKDSVSYLAYQLNIGGYEFVVDANNASVLSAKRTFSRYTNAEYLKQANVSCDTNPDGKLVLIDSRRSIYAYNIVAASDYNDCGNYIDIDSDKLVKANPHKNVDSSVYTMVNVARTYDFYAQLGLDSYDNQGSSIYVLFFTKNMVSDKAAANAHYSPALLMIGEKDAVFSDDIGKAMDIIAHEYTHLICQTFIDFDESVETSALNEALADILGNIIESYYDTETDNLWLLSEDAGYIKYKMSDPVTMDNFNQSDTDGHDNARIISHAAYLMSEDGGGLLTMDELAKLWYRTMLMMPSDCDFAQCRTLVELAGESMELSNEQMQCISSAFNNVGILDSNTVDYTIDENVELNVYGVDSQLHDNYTIYIKGRQLCIDNIDKLDKEALGIPLDFKYLSMMLTKEYSNVIEVKTAQTTNLYLPFGVYTITLCDNTDNSKTISFRVSVEGSGNKNKLDIYTDFSNDDISADKKLTKIIRYDQYTDASGYSYELSYNDKNQLVGLVHGQASSETKHDPTFTYSPDGNLLWIITGEPTDAYASGQNSGYGYEYDSSGYLIKEFGWEGGYAETKHYYDSSGNRIRSVSYGDAYVQTENHVYDPDGILLYSEVDVTYSDESAEHYVVEYDYSYKPFVLKRQNNAGWTQVSLCVENNISVLDLFMQDVQLYVDTEGYLEKAVTESETYCFYYTEDDDTSSPNTDVESNAPDDEESVEGFVGNQTAEQLRKSIVGSWGRIGSITSNYAFNSDGSCYGWIDKQEVGVYEISDNKTLTITFPWIKHQYSWTQESFDEWRSHSSEDFWYMTDSGELRLNGVSYYCYRDGKVNINYSTEGELLTKIAGAWVLDDYNEYRFFIDGTYEENTVLIRYGLLLSRENFETGPVEIIDDTHAKLWNEVESFGEIPFYTELEYDPETDTLCIGGSNNVYRRAEYSD